MANPIYQNLIELQSLDRQIKTHLDICETEKPRLEHIEKIRTRKSTQLAENHSKLSQIRQRDLELERHLHETTRALELNRDHQRLAKTQQQAEALEREATLFQKQLESIEAEQFTLLEESERLNQEQVELEQFLQGSAVTLAETQKEIELVCENEQRKIQGLELRRQSLLSDLPKEFRLAFEQALKVHRFRSPLSFITSRQCGQCHFQLDSMQASDVFTAKAPQLCSGCKRLLIDREQSQSIGS